jgi:adenylate kinase family enzyme
MKVFVTGPTASGKTTLARAMAESGGVYVDYDRSYRPAPISDPMPQTMNPPSARRFLDLLQDGCVVDNVVYDPALTTFNRWAAENGGVRICVVVPEYRSG